MENHLCVIIPTYNNCRTIKRIIEDVYVFIQDIFVVNDGSTDCTSKILNDYSDKVEIISYEKNHGKGYALARGFRAAIDAGFTHAITIDSDGQHFASDIPRFLGGLSDNPKGIIIGCRNLYEKNMPSQNTFANKFSNFWFRFQTGISLPDTQSGYRLYALHSLRGITFLTSRYEAELELLVFSAWRGVNISSIPISVYYPSPRERVSHFRPFFDFARISILNLILCIGALFIYYPSLIYSKIKKSF